MVQAIEPESGPLVWEGGFRVSGLERGMNLNPKPKP